MNKVYYKHYCDNIENVENYDKAAADNFKGWCCHHRLETHNSDGERRLVDITPEELIALDMYYHRPANELIFLTIKGHFKLHNFGASTRFKKGQEPFNKGKHHSEESKRKMSKAHKGHLCSEEQKRKISEKLKGRISPMKDKHHSEETKEKMSVALKGVKRGPFSKEHKSKLSEAKKGRHWKLVDGKRVWY